MFSLGEGALSKSTTYTDDYQPIQMPLPEKTRKYLMEQKLLEEATKFIQEQKEKEIKENMDRYTVKKVPKKQYYLKQETHQEAMEEYQVPITIWNYKKKELYQSSVLPNRFARTHHITPAE